MIYAYDNFGNKIKAEPNKKATCPLCNSNVISKCGKINRWHWAHENCEECDTWSEGETVWHLYWKSFIKKEYVEYKIGNHIADIFNKYKVIELQNSPISVNDLKERETYYKDMVWLFNGIEQYENGNIILKNKPTSFLLNKNVSGCYTYSWKWFKRTLKFCDMPVYVDLGDNKIFYFKTFRKGTYSGTHGCGYLLTYNQFFNRFFWWISKEGKRK